MPFFLFFIAPAILPFSAVSGSNLAMNDQATEYLQLSKRYSAMYDEELLQLAGEFNDLTDVAQQALRDELRLRKLDIPQPGPSPENERDAADDAIKYAAVVGRDMDIAPNGDALLKGFSSSEEAAIFYWALEIAGIRSRLITTEMLTVGPQLQVAAQDVARAQQVLAQPISAEVMEQYESAKETGDFQSPDCPRCGTPDPLLESADPVNEWFCESCGHQWKDQPASV
jgi:hypothetical protein